MVLLFPKFGDLRSVRADSTKFEDRFDKYSANLAIQSYYFERKWSKLVLLGAEWSELVAQNMKKASKIDFKVEERLLRDGHRDIGPMGSAGLPDPFEIAWRSAQRGSTRWGLVQSPESSAQCELAGFLNGHRGKMYLWRDFPRVFDAFLAKLFFFSGFPKKSCERLKGLAKSCEVPTV